MFGSLVKRKCPEFVKKALMPSGQFGTINSSDMMGKYWLLFFYPLDFTFVCPTEILSFARLHDQFSKSGCSIIGASVDSEYAHLAWSKLPKEEGGLGGLLPFPLMSDKGGDVASKCGVRVDDAGVALRATFIFDKQNICRHADINDLSVGRRIEEHLRVFEAIKYADEHEGEVCPAGWVSGSSTINTKKPSDYFKQF